MLKREGHDWQAPLVPGTLRAQLRPMLPGKEASPPPFSTLKPVLQPKAVGVARRARSRLSPILSLKLVGLGPDTPRTPCPRRGRRAGVGGVSGGPRPWPPADLRVREGQGRGGSSAPGAGASRAAPPPAAAGLKGGKGTRRGLEPAQVHLNRGVARAQP